MKLIKIILFCFVVVSCKNDKEPPIPHIYHVQTEENIAVKNDTVFFNGKKYDGFIYQLNPNAKDTVSIEGFKNGLLSGISKKWFMNGQLMEERHFLNGKKHGLQTAYWQNGNKRFEFIAKNDAYEGELKEWGSSGYLYHVGNYVNGQEEGAQKMWYENGKLRANYVIVQGKRYGLLGTKNCKNVSDSLFVAR
jgi:antitoxin component YwqK of YwqJK toxin-antitoxin module